MNDSETTLLGNQYVVDYFRGAIERFDLGRWEFSHQSNRAH